jgi:hypothetical protein
MIGSFLVGHCASKIDISPIESHRCLTTIYFGSSCWNSLLFMLHVGLENRGLQMVALDCRFVVHDEAVRVTDKLNKLLRIP